MLRINASILYNSFNPHVRRCSGALWVFVGVVVVLLVAVLVGFFRYPRPLELVVDISSAPKVLHYVPKQPKETDC